MRNKNYLYIGLVMLGALVGCSKEVELKTADKAERGAGIELKIDTKYITPGTTSAKDGGIMKDVLVVSVSTKTAGRKEIDGKKLVDLGEGLAETSIQIEGLTYGPHELYLFANTAGFDNVYPGIISQVNAMTIGQDFTAIAEGTFPALASGTIPSIANDVMPLTGTIKDIELGVGVTELTVELIRPFVWLTVNVYNQAEKELTVSGVSFNDFNPSTSYLFNHFVSGSEEYTPVGTMTYQAMPTCGDIKVPSRTSKAVFDGLMFESRLSKHQSDTYRVNLDFAVNSVDVELLTRAAYEAMAVNDTKNVFIANPDKTYGYFIGNNNTSVSADPEFIGSGSGFADSTAMWAHIQDLSVDSRYRCLIKKDEGTGTRNNFNIKIAGHNLCNKYPYTLANSGAWANLFSRDLEGDRTNLCLDDKYVFMLYMDPYYEYHDLLAGTDASGFRLGDRRDTNSNPYWSFWEIKSEQHLSKSVNNLVFKQINENREASPMLRMLRNTHITIDIFVGYYDNPVDDFVYDVAPWTSSVNEVIYQ